MRKKRQSPQAGKRNKSDPSITLKKQIKNSLTPSPLRGGGAGRLKWTKKSWVKMFLCKLYLVRFWDEVSFFYPAFAFFVHNFDLVPPGAPPLPTEGAQGLLC